ncbi:perlucin-like protein [Mercenaria mercenaria]|uniref:perlucin-like protein n=1 Tax=Mercenaria mercenaria TaxID=6596 RepID=UPI00234E9374|nr:perlucin-like protein [Mercenaria mercenaria]
MHIYFAQFLPNVLCVAPPSGTCFYHGKVFCNELGDELVEIETSAENEFIRQNLVSVTPWIGMTDIDQEGVWVWASTGIEAVFIDWHPSQPNNYLAAPCAAIWEFYEYRWVDEPCTELFHPICEQE